MNVIFIAGPFRGATPWDVECNVRRAEGLSLEVARIGAMPLCPHTNTRHFDGQCTDQFWLDGTRELMRRCDAVLLTPDWERSVGARAEKAEAGGLGLPVLRDIEHAALWLKVTP